jgi:hypothetical protein
MKKISALLSSLILIIGVVFLVAQYKRGQDIDIKEESNLSVYTTEQNEVPIEDEPNKENVLFFFNGDAVLKYLYATIDEMDESDAVDTIVKGIITDIDYVYEEGLAYTIITVNVLDSYKGKSAKEIKVYEDGGYVKVKDMLDEFKDNGMDLEKKLSKEKIENGLVEMKIFNAPHSQKGQQVILYLNENKNSNSTDSYMIVSSVYGKFTLDKNTGKYKRLAEDTIANFEDSISKDEMEKKLKNKFK